MQVMTNEWRELLLPAQVASQVKRLAEADGIAAIYYPESHGMARVDVEAGQPDVDRLTFRARQAVLDREGKKLGVYRGRRGRRAKVRIKRMIEVVPDVGYTEAEYEAVKWQLGSPPPEEEDSDGEY